METMAEDRVTINQLPEEMIEKVFEFLKNSDLKTSSLVCKM
jgi:F-box domain